ncbi:MAG: hypothetical protein CME71_01945 [Halobacteriovorax sp.]|nr:hypothetical protein [Halobacteriovorax sp.]|tara:strand:- start:1095 stop:1304 length:210 start_codon:yes stop_codon:yes gene_type:complete
MTSFKDRIIETIFQDFDNIKQLEPGKVQRNECNMLIKRIESALKLCAQDSALISKLTSLAKVVADFKSK